PNGLFRLAIRIARNLAVSEVRRTRAHRQERGEVTENLEDAPNPEGDTRDAVEASMPDPLLRAAIDECRGALPPKPRQVLDARITCGGADSDITLAEGLGMTLNTFLQNFTRARKMLAECLDRHGIVVFAGEGSP